MSNQDSELFSQCIQGTDIYVMRCRTASGETGIREVALRDRRAVTLDGVFARLIPLIVMNEARCLNFI